METPHFTWGSSAFLFSSTKVTPSVPPLWLRKQAPHIIQSEVWGTMQGCTPAEYLKLFTEAGYRVKRDAGCSMDVNLKQLPVAGQIVDYWMCH
jgi:hypothetical protein